MPRFERSGSVEGPVVQGFVPGGFSVEGAVHRAVLLTPRGALAWEPPSFETLTTDDVGELLALDPAPEFIILGTGSAHRLPPRTLLSALEVRGIGLEAMDSRAAARTWGLLRGEGRWIAAAIMPLD